MEIQVCDDILTVSSEHSERSQSNSRNLLYCSIFQEAFKRSFQLAENIIMDNASLKNGLLNIRLHRKKPRPQRVRFVEINTSTSVSFLKNRKANSAA